VRKFLQLIIRLQGHHWRSEGIHFDQNTFVVYRIAGNFEEESFHKLCSLRATCESFLHGILGMPHQPIRLL
jgi:hypothetical protein